MPNCDLTVLTPNDRFCFACHPDVPCFNHCCRDLTQALTPYDVLVLRSHLKLTWQSFLQRYATLGIGPLSGMPVVTLRFEDQADKSCPFVTEKGCGVYSARPSSCRLYPLARGVQRSRSDGQLTEHFALIKEPHCNGFVNGDSWTANQWIVDQRLDRFLTSNDRLLELIALKNRNHPRVLPPSLQAKVVMALYDLDSLKQKAPTYPIAEPASVPLPNSPTLEPAIENDMRWLAWGMIWVGSLFAGRSL